MKRRRLNAILELVRTGRISSQEDLLKALRAKGVDVSQSTLSRDIQDLGLAKSGGVYAIVGAETPRLAPSEDTIHRILREFVVDVTPAQGLLVIKTTTGSASPVAQALDEVDWPEPAGTLAGDNTIFVAVRSARDGHRLERRLRDVLK